MIPIPYQLGIIAASAILSGAIGFTCGYSKGTDNQVLIAKELEKKYQESLLESVTNNANLIIELEKRHEEANAVINDLISKPAGRVQLPRTSCKAGNANASSGSVQPIDAAGDILEQAERILGEGRQRTQGIIADAEIELQNCYVVKGYVAENWKLRNP